MKTGTPVSSWCSEREVPEEPQPRVLPGIYGGLSPAPTRSAGALLSRLKKPRVEAIAGVKQFTNSFSVFVFIFNSFPTHGPLPWHIGEAETAQGGKIVVAEYAKRPKSFQRTLGQRVAFLPAEIPHLFLPLAPLVPFCSFLIWDLWG